MTEGKNPHHICGRADGSSCDDCELRQKLICREAQAERRFFVISQLPFLTLSFLGMGMVGLATGIWWPIFAYSLAGIAFLGPVEMAVLCRHCPHYAREGPRLRCIAPNPFPKLFPSDPSPLNRLEKTIVILFSLFLLFFPSLVQAYGIWSFFAGEGGFALLGMVAVNIATAMAALSFGRVLARHFCSRCVNFSCPFNRVSEETARGYLERNPAIQAAWNGAWRTGGRRRS